MSETPTNEMDHGETDDAGTRYWCVSCEAFVPEHKWDFHETYHDPNTDAPSGGTPTIGQGADETPSPGDRDRILDEMGDHGDTRTVHPRLVCSACQSFVYLTLPKGFTGGTARAECDCRHSDPERSDLPDEWVRITQYVDTSTERDSQ